MTRRVSLPGADELFRSTTDLSRARDDQRTATADGPPDTTSGAQRSGAATRADSARSDEARPEQRQEPARTAARSRAAVRHEPDRRPTGREKHEQKITVYCSEDELIDLEHARLSLRRENGIAVDRGRIVREAVALVLADLEAKGEDSILVRRLRGR